MMNELRLVGNSAPRVQAFLEVHPDLFQPETAEARRREIDGAEHGVRLDDRLVVHGAIRMNAQDGAAVRVEDAAAHDREQQDAQVEPQRPVLDLVQVVADALLEGRVAAQAIDLRPTGNSGAHFLAACLYSVVQR